MMNISVFGERKQDVCVPGAVESERLVQFQIARSDIESCRVDTEQSPGQITKYRVRHRDAHDDWRATRAAVGTRIGEKVALALEA